MQEPPPFPHLLNVSLGGCDIGISLGLMKSLCHVHLVKYFKDTPQSGVLAIIFGAVRPYFSFEQSIGWSIDAS